MPVPTPSGPTPNGLPRFLGALFGFVFAGIGLTVLGFLWSAQGFGAPPLFFKIFGSFIALAFVGMGGAAFFGALRGGADYSASQPLSTDSLSSNGYTCPACGARLGAESDVSPKGDVKCGYCRKWFNIHG